MQDYISDWFIPMDFGNDMPDEEPSGEDNLNFDWSMEKKFILTDKFVINSFGIKLFQIKCTKSFKYAQKGDFGGYVEKEGNLD